MPVEWRRPSARGPKPPRGEKPMSDDAALSGAMMLSQQLEMYRWMDTLERARNNNELAIDNGLLRRDAEQIVGRYNLLVAEFNDLLRREAEALRNAKTALEAECERLRQENKATWSEVQLLRNIVRQDHPDMYL